MNRDADNNSSIVHCTRSPAEPSRHMYFFCNVPHLLKTTRNNLENSGYHKKTRHLHLKGQDIWTQLLSLYEWDVGLERTSPGLRCLHKLTYEHLHLTPALRMQVYMAVQVLSTSVANAMKAHGKHDTRSAEMFISYFDKFFDCLNVSNPHDGAFKRKPALEPYRSSDDWRFEWLQKDFVGFLKEWQQELASNPHLDPKTRSNMCLSRETLEGINITVNSFLKLAQLLLQSPGVDYLLSEKFNQDPLEMHFSKHRGAGGCSDNPTVEQVGYNMFSFYVASKCLKASRKANVRPVDTGKPVLDSTQLPKRPKHK
ncbi:uncharacterized protein LOC110990247 [Acanthaster planci]|uniref:Uncharacterized protein LOC110990247 n=1 Tax=Acanthaster planci TaxID=133434 RepID=A0A8B8A4H6_ACAPL|nr:uncharacterized protein LOC110990247 [Acanthaster planci]